MSFKFNVLPGLLIAGAVAVLLSFFGAGVWLVKHHPNVVVIAVAVIAVLTVAITERAYRVHLHETSERVRRQRARIHRQKLIALVRRYWDEGERMPVQLWRRILHRVRRAHMGFVRLPNGRRELIVID